MNMLRTFLLVSASAVILAAGAVDAQIQMDTLNPASAYDAGLLTPGQGGLDAALWQSTGAQTAAALLSDIKTPATGASLDLIKAVLLSGGVPPQPQDNMERESYMAARLQALLDIGDLSSFDALSERAGISQNSSSYIKLFTERALLGGDTDRACVLTDTITVERKAPYWAKLRAYCHFVRGEGPAAELTSDLLRRSKHKDDSFFALLGYLTAPVKTNFAPDIVKTPLDAAMARSIFKTKQISHKVLPATILQDIAVDADADAETRLAALLAAAHLMSPEQIGQALNGLAEAPLADLKPLETKIWTPEIWGQVYRSLKASTDMEATAKFAGALLSHADKAGALKPISGALSQEISFIPYEMQATANPYLFARIAVNNRDIGALRSLYQALPEDAPLRARIALASDALGNGFMLGELGVDIETRLTLKGAEKKRAIRDTYIAAALGARLSGEAPTILAADRLPGAGTAPGQLLVLQDAAKRRAQAETALRAAQILNNKSVSALRADSFAALLTALNAAGMMDMAGELAAQDFLGAAP